MNPSSWTRIWASDTVLDWINNGVPFQFKNNCVPPKFKLQNPTFTRKELDFLKIEVDRLLEQGYIEKCSDLHCVSPLKCVPKKNGKIRLYINLFELITFCSSGFSK